jgi:hypothetical protein
MPTEGGISKELLRTICEPFFEQMLTAVHATLHVQLLAQFQDTQSDAKKEEEHCFQSLLPTDPTSTQRSKSAEEPSTEDASNASECGAFSSVFSAAPSTIENDRISAKGRVDLAEEDSDGEKSRMVCRHWKTKGWCRLEDSCKFLHPAYKRGVATASVDKVVRIRGGSIDMHDGPASQTAQLINHGAADSKKKPPRKRRGKDKIGTADVVKTLLEEPAQHT